MQDYFIGFWGDNCPMMEQVVANIAALRQYCKEHNIPVYYTAQPKEQSDEDRALLNDMWGPGLTRSPEQHVAGRSGRVVMTQELLPTPVPASKDALRSVILPLLDESEEPMDDENLIDYGLDSVRMMALAARWRKVHGDIDFVMLAKKPTIDAWWALLSREVK